MARLNIGIAVAITGAALFLMRRPAAIGPADDEPAQETNPDPFDFLSFNPFDQVKDMIAPTDTDQAANNTGAFLAMIRKAEGTAGPNGYRTLFGGQLFNDFSDHPRQAKKFRTKDGRELYTSAAGAYQFLAISPIPGGGSTKVNTWDRISARLGLPDFGPESQDAAAIELIREAGALGDVRAGRFDQAVGKVRGIWASMPGAGYSQPERGIETLRLAYLSAGGNFA